VARDIERTRIFKVSPSSPVVARGRSIPVPLKAAGITVAQAAQGVPGVDPGSVAVCPRWGQTVAAHRNDGDQPHRTRRQRFRFRFRGILHPNEAAIDKPTDYCGLALLTALGTGASTTQSAWFDGSLVPVVPVDPEDAVTLHAMKDRVPRRGILVGTVVHRVLHGRST
jgi:hypothetical protein